MASGQEELSVTIPPDIITEILYRLPAKSIGRFRCVSKYWLSQLTHPDFIKIHLNNNTFSRQNHLIFKTQDIKRLIIEGSLFIYSHPFYSREVVALPIKFDLQLNSDPCFVVFCGSCDGLVLVRVRYAAHLSEKIVVINPTTREFLQLPQEENNNEYVGVDSFYGFGYDSVTDDYKVVCITYYYSKDDEDEDRGVSVYVCSLRNKTLKRLADSPDWFFISFGVFVSGFIHWIVWNDDGLIGIAAFSLSDECFSEVPFPKLCNRLKGYDREPLALGGKLAIFIRKEGVVWLMNQYGVRESWIKILVHGIDKVPIFKSNHYTKPSVIDDNGKILVANHDRMMVYEVEKATFTETVCVWNPEMLTIAGFYLESLVSPKLVKGPRKKDHGAG